MYPTLYHFFYSVFGTAPEILKIIPMLGFWIGIAFLAANWFGARELKRREKLGWLKSSTKIISVGKPASIFDLILNGVYGFIIGFKFIPLFYMKGISSDFVGYLMSGKGNFIAGILIGAGMAYWKYREANKEKLDIPEEREIEVRPHEHLGNITLIGIVGGIGGALIFAFLEQPIALWTKFMASGDISHLNGGLTVYGGVILAVFGNIYYFWKNNLSISQYLDALGPTVLLAYGIGRIGCQMAGDGDWGEVNLADKPDWMSFLPDWTWAYDYPNNINEAALPYDNYNGIKPLESRELWEQHHKIIVKVYPTPIYETLMSFGLFAFLWGIRKKITIPWIMFSLYVLFTGLERLLIEQIRINEPYETGIFAGYNQAQVISAMLIALGIAGVFYFYRKHHKSKPV